jgi:trans-aconitate methyltransferase
LALFKAEVINAFVRDNAVQSVVEFGCGDGNQLSLYELPRYTGLDVSPHSIAQCRERFADDTSKTFHLSAPKGLQAELALSIDVIFHLTEDDVFERYMRNLFASGTRFVIIYSSNTDRNRWFQAKHVRHRRFTDWAQANEPEWTLHEVIKNKYPLTKNNKNGSPADFFIYRKSPASGGGYIHE